MYSPFVEAFAVCMVSSIELGGSLIERLLWLCLTFGAFLSSGNLKTWIEIKGI